MQPVKCVPGAGVLLWELRRAALIQVHGDFIYFQGRQSCELGHFVLGTTASECHLVPSATCHCNYAFPRQGSFCISAFCPARWPLLSYIFLSLWIGKDWVQAFFLPPLRSSDWGTAEERGSLSEAKKLQSWECVWRWMETKASSSRTIFPCTWVVWMNSTQCFLYPQSEPDKESAGTMWRQLRSSGFLACSNPGWTWQCGRSHFACPWRGQLVVFCWLYLLSCSERVGSTGARQVSVISLPLAWVEVGSFTGFSACWSSRQVSSFG